MSDYPVPKDFVQRVAARANQASERLNAFGMTLSEYQTICDAFAEVLAEYPIVPTDNEVRPLIGEMTVLTTFSARIIIEAWMRRLFQKRSMIDEAGLDAAMKEHGKIEWRPMPPPPVDPLDSMSLLAIRERWRWERDVLAPVAAQRDRYEQLAWKWMEKADALMDQVHTLKTNPLVVTMRTQPKEKGASE